MQRARPPFAVIGLNKASLSLEGIKSKGALSIIVAMRARETWALVSYAKHHLHDERRMTSTGEVSTTNFRALGAENWREKQWCEQTLFLRLHCCPMCAATDLVATPAASMEAFIPASKVQSMHPNPSLNPLLPDPHFPLPHFHRRRRLVQRYVV